MHGNAFLWKEFLLFLMEMLYNKSIKLHPGSLKSLAVTVNATVFLSELALAAVRFYLVGDHDENNGPTCVHRSLPLSRADLKRLAIAATMNKCFPCERRRHMRLEIMLMVIMMHPRAGGGTVQAFVGRLASVGGSPHKRLFSLLVNC